MEWRVRYINYPAHYDGMRQEVLDTVDKVLGQGDVMLRQQLVDFEANFAAFCQAKYAVGVSNCTDALRLTLLAAGIGKGDEVITVSHTFVATAAAVHHVGATPVLIDIGDDHNMDIDLVEAALTPRTKAIIPVHLNGRVCDMGKLMAITERHGLLVIEDAAQALGGSFSGTRAGTFGLAGCFSFYPAKLLGAFGDAGAVVTNSIEIRDRITLLRNHGRMDDGNLSEWAFNCRLDNLHAAILDVKLVRLPGWLQRRREVAALYHTALSHLIQLRLPPPPVEEGSYYDVYQNYEIEAERRDELQTFLTEARIETMRPWDGRGVHQHPALGLTDYQLPRTEQMFKHVLMLPMYAELTNEDVRYICETISTFYAS